MPRLTPLLLASLLATACSNSSSSPPVPTVVVPFATEAHQPSGSAPIYLNDPILVSFSTQLDLDSVNPSTFVIEEFDATGQPTLVAVPGTYRLANNGTMLWFQPDLPTDGTYANGGLRAGRSYRVHVTDNLHDVTGQRLVDELTFTFQTRTGLGPAGLFRDRTVFGPARRDFTVPSIPGAAPFSELRLTFDQPIDPAYDNLLWRIRISYQNPSGPPGAYLSVPTTLELERNTDLEAVIVVRPFGALPSATTFHVFVAPTLRDLAGQDNTLTPGYDDLFGTFSTN